MIVKKVEPAILPVTLSVVKSHLRVNHANDDTLITSLIEAATRRLQMETSRQFVTATYQMKLNGWWQSFLKIPIAPLLDVTSITYIDDNEATQTLSTDNYNVATWEEPGKIYTADGATLPTLDAQPGNVTIEFEAGHMLLFTANDSTDVITIDHTNTMLSNNSRLQLRTTNTLPAGLSEATNYFLRDVSSRTAKLTATIGAAAIDITDTGTGIHYLDLLPDPIKQAIMITVGTWYDMATADVAIDFANVQEIPFASKFLLTPYKLQWIA